MSVYDFELVRCNGDIKVYCRIQNDWTGQIREHIRALINDKDGKCHFIADGQRVDVTENKRKFLEHEQYVKDCINWRKQTDWRNR